MQIFAFVEDLILAWSFFCCLSSLRTHRSDAVTQGAEPLFLASQTRSVHFKWMYLRLEHDFDAKLLWFSNLNMIWVDEMGGERLLFKKEISKTFKISTTKETVLFRAQSMALRFIQRHKHNNGAHKTVVSTFKNSDEQWKIVFNKTEGKETNKISLK